MRKLKTILPMLAFVLAVGMSFAFVDLSDDPTTDYIFRNGVFEDLRTEIDCEVGEEPCIIQFEGETQTYQVFDDNLPGTEKEGNGEVIILPPPE